MVNPWIHRDPHDSHLDIVHCDFRQLLHLDQEFVLAAFVPMYNSIIKSQVQDALLIAPVKDVGLAAVGLGPGGSALPAVGICTLVLPVVALGHFEVLKGAD